MKSDFTKTNLFSWPIYKICIDPNSYDKEKIINDIKYNKSLKTTRNGAHQMIGNHISDIHHSYNDFDNVNFRTINYEKLTDVYLEIFNEFFNKEISTINASKFIFRVVNYSAVTEGQYLPSHMHIPTADFATIHYLNFKNDHSLTSFYNSATGDFLKHIQPELIDILDNTAPDNSYLWQQFMFPVKEDDLLIFPAALAHEVTVQGPTKEPRITISSNIKFKLGK